MSFFNCSRGDWQIRRDAWDLSIPGELFGSFFNCSRGIGKSAGDAWDLSIPGELFGSFFNCSRGIGKSAGDAWDLSIPGELFGSFLGVFGELFQLLPGWELFQLFGLANPNRLEWRGIWQSPASN